MSKLISAAAHTEQFKVGDKVFARHDGAWFDGLNGVVSGCNSLAVQVAFSGKTSRAGLSTWWFSKKSTGSETDPLLTDLIILRDAPAAPEPTMHHEDHKLFTVLSIFRDMTKAERDEALSVLCIRHADSMPL